MFHVFSNRIRDDWANEKWNVWKSITTLKSYFQKLLWEKEIGCLALLISTKVVIFLVSINGQNHVVQFHHCSSNDIINRQGQIRANQRAAGAVSGCTWLHLICNPKFKQQVFNLQQPAPGSDIPPAVLVELCNRILASVLTLMCYFHILEVHSSTFWSYCSKRFSCHIIFIHEKRITSEDLKKENKRKKLSHQVEITIFRWKLNSS